MPPTQHSPAWCFHGSHPGPSPHLPHIIIGLPLLLPAAAAVISSTMLAPARHRHVSIIHESTLHRQGAKQLIVKR